jgi:hypothetical protein
MLISKLINRQNNSSKHKHNLLSKQKNFRNFRQFIMIECKRLSKLSLTRSIAIISLTKEDISSNNGASM